MAKTPALFDALIDELPKYKRIDDINIRELEKLPFLNAVIRESMRMYPPVTPPMPRVCPPHGAIISGYAIPGGVESYQTFAKFRSPFLRLPWPCVVIQTYSPIRKSSGLKGFLLLVK